MASLFGVPVPADFDGVSSGGSGQAPPRNGQASPGNGRVSAADSHPGPGNGRASAGIAASATDICRLVVRLPDRPGSLGRVTTLLGRLGVDIRQVRIVERDGEWATDEFVVAVPGPVVQRYLPESLQELSGVQVLACAPTADAAADRR